MVGRALFVSVIPDIFLVLLSKSFKCVDCLYQVVLFVFSHQSEALGNENNFLTSTRQQDSRNGSSSSPFLSSFNGILSSLFMTSTCGFGMLKDHTQIASPV